MANPMDILGEGLSAGGGGKNKMTPVAQQTPWDPAQPYLKDILEQAEGLNAGGNPLANPAMEATAAGEFMPGNNEWLEGMYASGADDITNRLKDIWSSKGRYNSEAMSKDISGSLGNFRNQLFAPAFEAERGRQFQAGAMAPTEGDELDWYTRLISGIGGMGGTSLEPDRPFARFIGAALGGLSMLK